MAVTVKEQLQTEAELKEASAQRDEYKAALAESEREWTAKVEELLTHQELLKSELGVQREQAMTLSRRRLETS